MDHRGRALIGTSFAVLQIEEIVRQFMSGDLTVLEFPSQYNNFKVRMAPVAPCFSAAKPKRRFVCSVCLRTRFHNTIT